MEGNATYDPLFDDPTEAPLPTASDAAPSKDSKSASSSETRRLAELAVNLRDNAAAGWLSCVMNSTLGMPVSADAFLIYRDVILKEAGDPKDPVERMLIEQLTLAHFSIGQLRMRSCSTDAPKMMLAYSDAAARLLGEFRRCALAVEEYRGKRAARTEKRDSAVGCKAIVPAPSNGHTRPSTNGRKRHRDTELASKRAPQHEVAIQDDNMHGDMPKWLKNRLAYPTPIA